MIRRTLDGRMKVAPDGTCAMNDRYLLVGRRDAARPDPMQAAWLYAQMVRWGQAPLSAELLAAAKAVFRPDLYDAASWATERGVADEPSDGIGAFAGPAFDPEHRRASRRLEDPAGVRALHCDFALHKFCRPVLPRAIRPFRRRRCEPIRLGFAYETVS